MPNVRREAGGSVLVYSPGGAIGCAVICWLEGSCPKETRLVPPHWCDLFQLVVEYLIFESAWLNVSDWASSWVSSTR